VLIRTLNDVKTEVLTARASQPWTSTLALSNPTSLSFSYMKALVTYYKQGGQVCKTEVVRFEQVRPRSERKAPLPVNAEAVSFHTKITAYQSKDLPADLQVLN
jgi:hypothetical protein